LGRYILQRLFAMILTLFAVSVLTFVLMHSIPGGPFTREKKLPQSTIDALNAKYHLNDPLWKQYVDYMAQIIDVQNVPVLKDGQPVMKDGNEVTQKQLVLDMGPSFKLVGRSVGDIVSAGFPITAKLGILATILTLFIGIPMGVISALKQNRWQDYTSMFLTTLGVTIPNFVIAILLMYVFCIKLKWLPVRVADAKTLASMVLPVIALAAYSLSFISRLMRSSMLDVTRQDYIRTARAKGLSEFKVISKHAVKNAIIPVVTYVGPMFSGLLTGSFVIEKLFAVSGIGRFFVESIENRDYTMIMGVTILDAALLIFINFLVDIAYGLIDPRIKLTGIKEE